MGTCSEWQLHPISWFHREPLNGRNRRNLVIGAGIDEGLQSTWKLPYPEIKTFGKFCCFR